MIEWRALARGVARGPAVTSAVIAVCCALFVAGPVSGLNPPRGRLDGEQLLAAQTAYFERWGVVPAELMSGDPGALLTPFTALFIHGNWLHLLGNMLFLYVFGAMAEERMGRVEFFLFYAVTGGLALSAYAAAHAGSQQTLVGASGAISGVLGAFLFLFPRARVTSLFPFLFFLPLRFPAWIVLIFWFVLQGMAATGAGTGGAGVAYLAHLVGFALGFLYAWARSGRGTGPLAHLARRLGRTAGRPWRRTRVKVPAAATEGESQP
ncbi:rhomboid family intramembrane serine protease [Streptomyces yaizuensis]|uniref:Rhomboid family intramembrane serine protease n=1 Tax=Streptomyces yaizuensis TaxID=2989713 RepID=A0ABQ5NVA2_9ACTN|nr:rhomboid family intramembrane serine protease [Streptomyces sp. YSPA8]GLF94130.1 rhomboid family intramembrane serine protease [Streptomyces sp. YSPA8]